MKWLITTLVIFSSVLYSETSIYVFESDASGFNTKSFFYDNGEEVIAFGGQFTPQIAQQAIDFLRTKTTNPISYLVITHPNPDKFNGATVFQAEGVQVICSQSTAMAIPEVHGYKKYYFVHIAKMFTEETYPQMPTVDIVFEKTLEIYLANGEKLVLEERDKPGVSSTQTLGCFPKTKALFVGDLVHHKAHAWLEGGIVHQQAQATISLWIEHLHYIAQSYADYTVYGGRGEAVNAVAAAKQQIRYLQTAQQITRDYIVSLGNSKGELQGEKAGVHHKKIEELLVKSFPNYKINYMVRFGIYGLINALLK
ncbi:MBL fold metallo-hydrolase [Candidatus Uabimicrobium amorphum]|uniref:MBL fold metallo-hydrolase n=1 Tax=Uabimicrobium amorphum TaxID=2596890 RepID=A0A5S9INZ3_UABAM|nr:MBL fold metallo-hydrolase [Candidatus Uabimicrobium amorphum]BBM85403.1 MBL fold metallo-hydrolase [Candidatus Uabimicrobium amorphum]